MRIQVLKRLPGVSVWIPCILLLLPGSLVDSDCLASDSGRVKCETTASGTAVAAGRFSRVLVVRLKNGEDLLKGLERAVSQEAVRNGVFMGAFGSLTSYHVHVVNNT